MEPTLPRPSLFDLLWPQGRTAVDRVSVADLHATVLHQMGLDHEVLTYHHSGRDETLTDPSLTNARVVHQLIA